MISGLATFLVSLYALATAAALVLRFASVIITLSPFYVNTDELGLPSLAFLYVAL